MTDKPTDSSDAAFSYAEMRDAIEKGVPSQADREALIAKAEHLEATEGTESWESAYEHFIDSARAHATVLGQFIARLEAMLGA